MIYLIRKLKKLSKMFKYLFKQAYFNTDYYQTRMIVENRILLKKINKERFNVVLIAFEPSTWLMFQSIYDTFSQSGRINITVLVIPYAHSTLSEGTYKDAGLREYLDNLGIPYIYGYNKKTKTWIDIFHLHPDYVFYQTPYNGMYPDILKSEYISQFAQICDVPYGAALITGDIENIIYPLDFFRDASYLFVETEANKKVLLEYFKNNHQQYLNSKIHVVGLTKIEAIYSHLKCNNFLTDKVTILWLPRWNTNEGLCSFFDYYEMLVDYVESHENICLIFRPHPLMFQNFITTGEMTNEDITRIKQKFSTNKFILDDKNEYIDSFNQANILISDPTSLMYEFFITAKPIIYTQKKEGVFNQLGQELLSSYYCVKNDIELKTVLDNLITNDDVLFETRKELSERYLNNTLMASKKILEQLTGSGDMINDR